MKKKYWLVLVPLVIVLLAAGGYFYFLKNRDANSSGNTNTDSTYKTNPSAGAKTDNSQTQNQNPVQTKPSAGTTSVPQSLGNLDGVSLTAYLYNQSSTAPDGTTTMPAGSIAPFFYMEPGTFTIQKMDSGSWKDVITSQSYPGHGGLAAWFDGPTEDNIQYRVLKIENGNPTNVSKTFIVKRSDLSGGVYTYN